MVAERFTHHTSPWVIASTFLSFLGLAISLAFLSWTVASVIFAASMLISIMLWSRSPVQKAMDAFDATGNQTCPECLHDLRGLESPGKCPECGEPFSAEVLERARELLQEYHDQANPKQ